MMRFRVKPVFERIMKKYILLIMALLVLVIFILIYMPQTKNEYKGDDILSLYQDFSPAYNGLIRIEMIIQWKNGNIVSATHKDTYDNEINAKNFVEQFQNTEYFWENYNLSRQGNIVTYKEWELNIFKNKSYNELKQEYQNSSEWNIGE
jgi:hypothetical protein